MKSSTKYSVTTLLRDKLTIELAVETVVNRDRRMNEFLWHELRIEAPLRQIIRPPAVHALVAPCRKNIQRDVAVLGIHSIQTVSQNLITE